MNNILVTGGSGFLGRHLIKALAKTHNVHALVRKPYDIDGAQCHIYDGSMDSIDTIFSKQAIDFVIHLAAITSNDDNQVDALLAANITLGTQLLQSMSNHDCKVLINTGTFWQHNKHQNYHPICLYAATKEAFERILDYYVLAHGFKAITLVLTDVYGPNDPRKKIFSLLNAAAQDNQALDVTACEQSIYPLHVEDAVAGYLQGLHQACKNDPSHQRFFLAADKSHTLKEVIEAYCELHPLSITVNYGKRPYREREIMHPYIGQRLPGWQTKIELHEGLQQTIQAKEYER